MNIKFSSSYKDYARKLLARTEDIGVKNVLILVGLCDQKCGHGKLRNPS